MGDFVCSGGCWAPTFGAGPSCQSDADCANGTFCRPIIDRGAECVPYAEEGDTCGSSSTVWYERRCAQDLVCTDFGTCREPCTRNADCGPRRYCSSTSGVCRNDGECISDSDCEAEGNTYSGRVDCNGFGECTGRWICRWTCIK